MHLVKDSIGSVQFWKIFLWNFGIISMIFNTKNQFQQLHFAKTCKQASTFYSILTHGLQLIRQGHYIFGIFLNKSLINIWNASIILELLTCVRYLHLMWSWLFNNAKESAKSWLKVMKNWKVVLWMQLSWYTISLMATSSHKLI